MITNDIIVTAIGTQLWNLTPSLHIFRENVDVPEGQSHPFLVFQHVPVSRTDNTLKGGGEILRGFVVVTVMADVGGGDTSASTIAHSVAALFPYALRLPVTGGEITIIDPPEVMQGYLDDPHWRIPVRIPYSAS